MKKQITEQVVARLTGEIVAHCDAGGVIKFGTKVPRGHLLITRGPDKEVRDLMSRVARLAYDGKTLLVPGVPEAPDQDAGIDALIKFKTWITTRKAK